MTGEFDRIIGYGGVKRELEQTADILRNLEAYKAAGAKTPSGMLIHGAPGLGKSLMAECLIAAAGLPAFTVRKDKANGDFVDHVDRTFKEAATRAPSIVYLDDMDKFANADEQHRNAEEYVAVQSAIDSVKGRDVFVLATANEMDCLPGSLTRPGRFDRRVDVRKPDGEEAEAIIKHYLSGRGLADDVDWDDVAMLMSDCTCAELEVTLNEALIASVARREEKISRESFMEAFFKTRVRAPQGPDLSAPCPPGSERRRRVAVHEAGHAVVYEVLAGRSISLATALRKWDDRGGMCWCRKPDGLPDDEWAEIRVIGGLGGRAATELVYGTADAGAGDDLRRAYSFADARLRDGLSFGLPYLTNTRMPHGDDTQRCQDLLLKAEVERLYQRAKRVLAENRGFLDAMADAIEERSYLVSSDIQAIKANFEIAKTTP